MDALVARECIDHVHAIKIDVEAEVAGAQTAPPSSATSVRCSCSRCARRRSTARDRPCGELDERLEQAGYACFEIDDTTGALCPEAALAAGRDRNVVAAAVERAGALLDAVRRLDD